MVVNSLPVFKTNNLFGGLLAMPDPHEQELQL